MSDINEESNDESIFETYNLPENLGPLTMTTFRKHLLHLHSTFPKLKVPSYHTESIVQITRTIPYVKIGGNGHHTTFLESDDLNVTGRLSRADKTFLNISNTNDVSEHDVFSASFAGPSKRIKHGKPKPNNDALYKLLCAEHQLLQSLSHPFLELRKWLKIRENCLKKVLEKERLFLDATNVVEENIQVGEKLLSDLRNLNLEVFRKWKLWREWHQCMAKWAWKHPRNIENYEKIPSKNHSTSSDPLDKEQNGSMVEEDKIEDEIMKGVRHLELKDFKLNWGKGNYFDKMAEDTETLHNSKWHQFFRLEPLDIFLIQAGRKAVQKDKRPVGMTFEVKR